MKLYYHPLSQYCQKVLIACYEKNISFEGEIVDLMNPQAHEEYQKIYPIGKIPYLVLDNDWKIPESSIIVEYLDTHFDKGPLLIPKDKDQSRQARFHDRMMDLYFCNPLGSIFLNSLKPKDQQNPEAVKGWRKTIDIVYGFLNQHLEKNTWVMGNDFTIADCALAPNLNYARNLHPFDQQPNISNYWNRLSERPSIKRLLKEMAPYLEEFEKNHRNK